MSSNFNHHYYESNLCTSCGKTKSNFPYDLFEKYNFKDDNSSMFEDKHSVKYLINLLSTLINKSDNVHPTKYHEKDQHDWWKHEHKFENHDNCSCKCKKHHDKHEHDCWKHDDMFDNHHGKHDCHCKKDFDKPRNKSFNHVELKSNWKKPGYDDLFTLESSSHDYLHAKGKKCNKCGKCSKYDNCSKVIHLESSSMDIHKHDSGKPEKIWLSDQLALLFRNDLLNLDHLFNQLNNEHKKPHHEKKHYDHTNCHCQKDWDEEYKRKRSKYVTKEYYYKGMPLKKFKRNAAPYKKYM